MQLHTKSRWTRLLPAIVTSLYVIVLYLIYREILRGEALFVNLFWGALFVCGLAGIVRRKEYRAVPLLSWDIALASVVVSLSLLPKYTSLAGVRLAPVLLVLGVFVCWPLLWGMKCILRDLSNRACPPPKGESALRASGRRAGLCVFLCTLAALLLMWTIVFPYHSSPDTHYQWAQIHGEFPYNNVHSFGHTFLLRLLLGVVDHYGFVVLIQMLMVSGLYAMFAAHFARRGASTVLLAPLFTVFACTRFVLSPTFTPWKDMPYSFCAGLVTLLAMRWAEEPDAFRGRGIWRCAALGLTLAGCFLMRQNGIVLLLILGAYFLFAMLRRRMVRGMVVALTAAAIALTAVNGFAYRALDVQSPRENGFPYQVFASGIAAVVHDPGTTEEELSQIDEVLPVDWMREHYSPSLPHKYLIWDHDEWYENLDDPANAVFNNRFVTELGLRHWEVVALYFKLLPRHFAACACDVQANTSMIWGHSKMSSFPFDNITLLVILLLAFARRRVRGGMLVCAPMLLNVVSIAISTITDETRYLLPTTLLFPALLLFALTGARTASVSQPEDSPGNSRPVF